MFDAMMAIFLALYAIILGPIGVLRGPLVLERAIWYLCILWPIGALSKTVRIAIDWRLGYFDLAIAQTQSLVSTLELQFQSEKKSFMLKRILEDFYTLLTRAYMHAGLIDEAMQVILRSKKILDTDRLSGLPHLDAKTAHLIRAGLAAGKLLEGGGLATMFIKSETPLHSPPPRPTQPTKTSPTFALTPKSLLDTKRRGVIIPFRPKSS
jgi:hypothetical protein